MDFESDLRSEIILNLPHDKSDAAVVAALSSMHTTDLLIAFFNWMERLVHPHKRKVLIAPEAKKSSLWKMHEPQINKIISKIENGEEILCHLSKGIINGFSLADPKKAKNLKKKKDLDLLINDWGIHHLHLSDEKEGDFVKRTGDLLFVIFTQDAAYIIDVAPHGVWTNQQFVERAVRNWPGHELFLDLKGIMPGTPFTDKQVGDLRSAGMAGHVVVDGKVYISRTFSLTMAGTAGRVTKNAISFKRTLMTIRDECTKDPEYLRSFLEQTGATYPADPDFRVAFLSTDKGYGFCIRENKTGAVFWPGSWYASQTSRATS